MFIDSKTLRARQEKYEFMSLVTYSLVKRKIHIKLMYMISVKITLKEKGEIH